MNVKKQLWEKYNTKDNEKLALLLVNGNISCDFCVYGKLKREIFLEKMGGCAGCSCVKGIEQYIEEGWEK